MVEPGKSSVFSEPGVVDPELAEEIGLMLDEGVVQTVQDTDLCMLLGGPAVLARRHARLPGPNRVAETVRGQRFRSHGVASLPA